MKEPYVITDGKNYVYKNPFKSNSYKTTTSPVLATTFSYNKAEELLKSQRKSMSWIKKDFKIVDSNTNEVVENKYKGKGGKYVEKSFDEKVLDDIFEESNSILGLAGWNKEQLDTYRNILNNALSYYDSAISDIEHAIQDRKIAAHIRAKIIGLLQEVREKHEDIKQCQDYVRVMTDAIDKSYSLSKIKNELSKAKHKSYKGRTEYYNRVMEMLGE